MRFSSVLFVLTVALLNFFPLVSRGEELDRSYGILGLSAGAAFSDVQAAYRRLASQYLDQRTNGEPEIAKEKFRQVHEAFQMIQSAEDPEIRQPADRKAAEAIRKLGKAVSVPERIQALDDMAEFAENIVLNEKLRERADETVRQWIGDGMHVSLSELKAYYGFLGRFDFLIYNLIASDKFYEIPFLYNGIILEALASRPDVSLEDVIHLIQDSGGMATDSYGFRYGASYKFKSDASEALFRFALHKDLLHSYEDLEKYFVRLKPIYKDGQKTLFFDMDRFLGHYFQNVLSWVPRLKPGDFERLKFILPYHQNLILLEEALRQHLFHQSWEVIYAVEHVQRFEEGNVGDVQVLGLNPYLNPGKPSAEPEVVRANQERRRRVYKAAFAMLKELGGSPTEFRKLSTSLGIGSIDRSLMKMMAPFVRFQWPERDYRTTGLWEQKPITPEHGSLGFNPSFFQRTTCQKIYRH